MVVPSSLRKRILNELYLSHRGIVKMKAISRCISWWPNFDNDIKNYGQLLQYLSTSKIRILLSCLSLETCLRGLLTMQREGFPHSCPRWVQKDRLCQTPLRLSHCNNYYTFSLDFVFLYGCTPKMVLRLQQQLQI
ncbi:unnamed protein product [Lepeophtheirus salmonis]|uniref:(salmon louse) hypothetical protein n=1 Tax=Lepeophtheirus salmonis TaxID=72036 RepID=A0A7R8CDE6_LEPSM|nr:unnamed protein product [Lepeophtheirus salmonis]CAF2778989.1 unnamed protein product [Lepeophtheirus salmonis]